MHHHTRLPQPTSRSPRRPRRSTTSALTGLIAVLSIVAATATPAAAAKTTIEVVSVDASGDGVAAAELAHDISADGRFVVFGSTEAVIPGTVFGGVNLFRHDRLTGDVDLVSASVSGDYSKGSATAPAISDDGRFVAFESDATDLAGGSDKNGADDVFVRDMATGQTTRVSSTTSGVAGNGASTRPWVSGDGSTIGFSSWSTDLVAGDTNAARDAFAYDVATGTVERVSLGAKGEQPDDTSLGTGSSHDGRMVVFQSLATNIVTGDTGGMIDVFVRDRVTGAVTLVSADSQGGFGNWDSDDASISGDGDTVAFRSYANDLVANDTNATEDIFVRQLSAGVTTRVSVASNGTQANAWSFAADLSNDGKTVVFTSDASNIVPGDSNADFDVFAHDLTTGKTHMLSVGYDGSQGSALALWPKVDGDGSDAIFWSPSPNLVPNDPTPNGEIYLVAR